MNNVYYAPRQRNWRKLKGLCSKKKPFEGRNNLLHVFIIVMLTPAVT